MLTKSQEKLKQKCIDHWFENLMMLQLNYLSGHEDLDEDVYVTGDGCPFCQHFFDSFGVPRSAYKNLFKAIGKEIDFLIAL